VLIELNTVLSIKILQIMYKMWINYRYFTVHDNFMFSCRQTSMSLIFILKGVISFCCLLMFIP